MPPLTERKEQPRILGLRKNIFLLGLTSLFNDFSSEMIYAIFPAFFTSVLKTGAESLGIVDGVAEGLSNIFKIYSGSFSDQVGKRKPLVVLGYIVSVVIRPFYVFAGSVTSVLGLRVVDRIGKGLRESPRDAIISLSADEKELGFSFGYHRAMDTIGAILGPLVAYALLTLYPLQFNRVFMTSFFVGLLALITLVWISDVAVTSSRSPVSLLAAWRALSPQFKHFLFAILLLSVGTLPVAVVLLKTESLGLVVASIPLFYMIYNVSYAGFAISAGKMSDRIGSRSVLMTGYAVLILGYGILAWATSLIALVAGFLILGLFVALTDGVSRALASTLTKEGERGGAMGLLRATNGFGALLAGVLGGYVWQTWGPGTAFVSAAGIVCVGLVALYTSIRREAQK